MLQKPNQVYTNTGMYNVSVTARRQKAHYMSLLILRNTICEAFLFPVALGLQVLGLHGAQFIRKTVSPCNV